MTCELVVSRTAIWPSGPCGIRAIAIIENAIPARDQLVCAQHSLAATRAGLTVWVFISADPSA